LGKEWLRSSEKAGNTADRRQSRAGRRLLIAARARVCDREGGFTIRGEIQVIIAGVVVICIVLLVLAFVAPRLSIWPQRGVDRTLGTGQRAAGTAPGPLGRWLQKPFGSARRAANKSAGTGRSERSKLGP
jgi:hypothetical protein